MRLKKTLFITISLIVAVIANLTAVVPILAASIILSSTSATVGSSISVSGSGYLVSTQYSITFQGTPVGNGMTSTSGDVSPTSFSVPLRPRGSYTIALSDGTNTNTGYFSISPSVSTSSSSGYVGDTFFVSGNGFTASSTVTIYFDSTSVGTAYADTNGAFSSTTLTILEIPRGTHLVRGADSSGYSVNSASFNVNPKIILSTGAAAVGSQLVISGNGYSASSTVSFYIDEVVLPFSTSTGATGSFSSVGLTIPNVSGGSHTLKVQDSGGGSATASISVSAVMAISPVSGPAGSTITVSGKGFGSNKSISLTWNGASLNSNPATITTDNAGAFSATVSAPVGQAGTYSVSASDGTLNSSADFSMKASINSSVSTAEVGVNITIKGIGFSPNVPVSIKFDNAQIGNGVADTIGAFTINVIVPAAVAGPHTITAAGTLITSTTSVTITSSLSLNPEAGYVGGDIALKGSGFSASKAVTIKYDDVQNATSSTDASGSFTASFKAPVSKGGNHSITATDGIYSKTATFAMDSTPPPLPTGLLPENKTNADSLTKFSWAPVTDPSGVIYELQVSTDANFAMIILDKKGLITPVYQAVETEKFKTVGSDAPYYWRVKAIDAAGNESDWTKPQTFSVGFIFPAWGIYVIFGLISVLAAAGGFWIGRRTSYRWDW